MNDHHHQQWIEAALAHYDLALADDPTLSEAWHARGNLLSQIHCYEEAIASYDRALALDFSDDIQTARNWVICLMQYHTQPTLTSDIATAFVHQAISRLSSHQCIVEAELIESLQHIGISSVHATELVTFIPLAFGRVFLQRTAVSFSPHFVWVNPDTHQETSVVLAKQPFYQIAYQLASQWMQSNTCMNVLLPLASLSSEVEAVTQALNQGLSLNGSQFSAPRAYVVKP
ncbi:MAG: tetratricopeptide repeat protein [Elainellaceae cyanobacterium]